MHFSRKRNRIDNYGWLRVQECNRRIKQGGGGKREGKEEI